MSQILPDRMPAKVAAVIELRIRRGELHGRMPGLRTLARDCRVSVPTVAGAMRILEAGGLLCSGGGRRRWHVAADAAQFPPRASSGAPAPGTETRQRRLVFISEKKLSQLDFSTLEIHAHLVSRLNQDGWEVVHRQVSYEQAKRVRKRWDEAIDIGPQDALVVLTGTRAIGRWAAAQGRRVLFLGGTPTGTRASCVTISAPRMLRDSIVRLAALGHRTILCPMLARNPDFVRSMRGGAAEARAIAQIEGPAPEVLLPVKGERAPQQLWDLLMRRFSRSPAPDAMVFLDWAEAVTGISTVHHIGLRVPADVSLVVLSHTNSMEWHLPAISHYQYPLERITRVVRNWAVHNQNDASPGGTVLVPPKWVPGESVRDRRRE